MPYDGIPLEELIKAIQGLACAADGYDSSEPICLKIQATIEKLLKEVEEMCGVVNE